MEYAVCHYGVEVIAEGWHLNGEDGDVKSSTKPYDVIIK